MANFDTLAGELHGAQAQNMDLLELVAAKFQAAAPESTKVVREWRILGGRIKEVDLHLGDLRYRFESPRKGSYTVTRQNVVHGVAVGNMEILAPAVWVSELIGDLARYAAAQGLSAAALEKLTFG
jgi:hypothetical protein